jgi:hypothetical protein
MLSPQDALRQEVVTRNDGWKENSEEGSVHPADTLVDILTCDAK